MSDLEVNTSQLSRAAAQLAQVFLMPTMTRSNEYEVAVLHGPLDKGEAVLQETFSFLKAHGVDFRRTDVQYNEKTIENQRETELDEVKVLHQAPAFMLRRRPRGLTQAETRSSYVVAKLGHREHGFCRWAVLAEDVSLPGVEVGWTFGRITVIEVDPPKGQALKGRGVWAQDDLGELAVLYKSQLEPELKEQYFSRQ